MQISLDYGPKSYFGPRVTTGALELERLHAAGSGQSVGWHFRAAMPYWAL